MEIVVCWDRENYYVLKNHLYHRLSCNVLCLAKNEHFPIRHYLEGACQVMFYFFIFLILYLSPPLMKTI